MAIADGRVYFKGTKFVLRHWKLLTGATNELSSYADIHKHIMAKWYLKVWLTNKNSGDQYVRNSEWL